MLTPVAVAIAHTRVAYGPMCGLSMTTNLSSAPPLLQFHLLMRANLATSAPFGSRYICPRRPRPPDTVTGHFRMHSMHDSMETACTERRNHARLNHTMLPNKWRLPMQHFRISFAEDGAFVVVLSVVGLMSLKLMCDRDAYAVHSCGGGVCAELAATTGSRPFRTRKNTQQT